MQALKILLIGCAFILLFVWYAGAIKVRENKNFNVNLIKKVLNFDKVSRNCYITSSAGRLQDKNVPLIIFLHGMDGAWPGRRITKPQYDFINRAAWDNDFIAVFPQGSQGSCHDPKVDTKNEFMFHYCWDTKGNNDRDFIRKLKEGMIAEYKVDPKRVYLIGFSNGGYFVSDYFLFHQDDLFAGYGIHSAGAINQDKSKTDFSKLNISLSVGNKDQFQIEEMRSLKKFLLNKGMSENKDLRYFEYQGSHEMSKNAIESEIKFFLKKD